MHLLLECLELLRWRKKTSSNVVRGMIALWLSVADIQYPNCGFFKMHLLVLVVKLAIVCPQRGKPFFSWSISCLSSDKMVQNSMHGCMDGLFSEVCLKPPGSTVICSNLSWMICSFWKRSLRILKLYFLFSFSSRCFRVSTCMFHTRFHWE